MNNNPRHPREGEGPKAIRQRLTRDHVAKSEHDAWFRAEVERGLRELSDPNVELIPHEQVVAEWEVEKADLLARIAARKQR